MSCSCILESLFSINKKIHYLAVVNLFGEVIHWNTRDPSAQKEEIAEHLGRIAFATNSLTFENMKLMVVDKDNLRILVMNLNENSFIVGVDQGAAWHDLFSIVGSLCQLDLQV